MHECHIGFPSARFKSSPERRRETRVCESEQNWSDEKSAARAVSMADFKARASAARAEDTNFTDLEFWEIVMPCASLRSQPNPQFPDYADHAASTKQLSNSGFGSKAGLQVATLLFNSTIWAFYQLRASDTALSRVDSSVLTTSLKIR